MMANRVGQGLPLLVLALTLISGCVGPPATPPPMPQRSPVVLAPQPPPMRVAPVATAWQDNPATPGDWRWSAATSSATFGDGLAILRCDPASRRVTLLRAANPVPTGSAPMTIQTTSTTRTLSADPVAGALAVTLDARDPLLDAIAFSRGRFAIEVAGQPALYLPSWSEVGRVIEDCR